MPSRKKCSTNNRLDSGIIEQAGGPETQKTQAEIYQEKFQGAAIKPGDVPVQYQHSPRGLAGKKPLHPLDSQTQGPERDQGGENYLSRGRTHQVEGPKKQAQPENQTQSEQIGYQGMPQDIEGKQVNIGRPLPPGPESPGHPVIEAPGDPPQQQDETEQAEDGGQVPPDKGAQAP